MIARAHAGSLGQHLTVPLSEPVHRSPAPETMGMDDRIGG